MACKYCKDSFNWMNARPLLAMPIVVQHMFREQKFCQIHEKRFMVGGIVDNYQVCEEGG